MILDRIFSAVIGLALALVDHEQYNSGNSELKERFLVWGQNMAPGENDRFSSG
jgi:hypothetical protein